MRSQLPRSLRVKLVLLAVIAGGFLAGRRSVPRPETELRWSANHQWIEVYSRGELVAEYSQARDGAMGNRNQVRSSAV